jgi:PEP-CTERM motif
MLRRLKQLGAAVAAVVLMAGSAQAATVIDFSTGLAGEGGTIRWDGTNLIGSNIPIGAVSISGAPTGDGVYVVSGSASGQGGANRFGTLNFNTSANNNFVTISGCIGDLGVGTDSGSCVPVDLMNGTFSGWTTDGQGLLNAFGPDAKGGELLDAIDWPADVPWTFFGFSLTTATMTPDGRPYAVISTDIKNTAIPEPATMMLLGTGLLAAFRARRRQQV